MHVKFVNLAAQFIELEDELVRKFKEVGRAGAYILGTEVESFERDLAIVCGTKYAVSVANGTDALVLVLKAWGIGPGDEVITAPNSFIASAGAIVAVGATPVFVDVKDDFNIDPVKIRSALTDNTKVIIPVHLTGNPADMDAINNIAEEFELKVLEDAAQAIGARYKQRPVGSLGDAAGFSLHPLKNLHLLGDAGFVSTNDELLYQQLLQLRNHGLINRYESAQWGFNSRLDAMQAAFGNVKLKRFAAWTKRFQDIASLYYENLQDYVKCPNVAKDSDAVFHNFVIQVPFRDQLMAFLAEKEIETKIHYPIPLHLMPCSSALPYQKGDFPTTELQSEWVISLPIYPELSDQQVIFVCDAIKEYCVSLLQQKANGVVGNKQCSDSMLTPSLCKTSDYKNNLL
jgi:dTDP-4-amino-4,6-dideoxygalactose transaminase